MPTSKALNMMPTEGEAQKYSCLYKYHDHSYTRKEYYGWITEMLILLWSASSLGEILAHWAGPFLNRTARTFSILALRQQTARSNLITVVTKNAPSPFQTTVERGHLPFLTTFFLQGSSKLRNNTIILRRMPSCLWEWYLRMSYIRPSCPAVGE